MSASPLCNYDLDRDLRIVSVDEGWSAFARENGAVELLPPAILGQPLLAHITDPTTEHVYRTLFDTVRSRRQATAVPFRCDSPAQRRSCQLHIEPLPQDGLHLWTEVLSSEGRDEIRLLDRYRTHADALLSMCSWCKSVDVDGRWYSVEDAVAHLGLFDQSILPALTHGICDACFERLAGPE
ncbi:MAG: hypothetical protein ABSB58_11160 [Gemmatimonadales bacterium]|jgi:hypothetical protein